MRRREAGRGAVPAGLGRNRATRAAPGLRPGPLGDPARSWLGGPDFDLVGDEARPAAVHHREEACALSRCFGAFLMRYRSATDAHVARREAPACLREEARATRLALFGAPFPLILRRAEGSSRRTGASPLAAKFSVRNFRMPSLIPPLDGEERPRT